MADKLATALPKIAKILRLVLNTSTPDGDWNNALTMLMATLREVDPGGHEITKLIEAPSSLSEEDMKVIFDAGREQGRTEIIEQQRKTTSVLTTMFDNLGSYGGIRQGRISGHDTHNGYPWSEIAESCHRNANRIPSKHHGFLEGMADTLTGHGTISEPQARYLGNLFDQYLGRII